MSVENVWGEGIGVRDTPQLPCVRNCRHQVDKSVKLDQVVQALLVRIVAEDTNRLL